jgi:hypothetical protein
MDEVEVEEVEPEVEEWIPAARVQERANVAEECLRRRFQEERREKAPDL